MEKRVLVVDDEVDIVEGLTTLLTFEQIDSTGALDCSAAVEQLRNVFYPVVLADFRLRTEDEGRRLLDAIRELAPRSRVVVLTGYATPLIEEELLSRGVVMVLHKPAPSSVILEAIRALLDELERQAAEAGDDVDVEQLYVDVRRKLLEITRKRFGLSPESSEDVIHDAWLLFLRKRGLIREARPWLAGTVANLSRQVIDRRVRKRETSAEHFFAAIADDRGGDITDVIAVREALEQTEERGRTLCSLIGIDGFSYDEVSAATGIPLGSVGPLYIRAKKKMRDILAN